MFGFNNCYVGTFGLIWIKKKSKDSMPIRKYSTFNRQLKRKHVQSTLFIYTWYTLTQTHFEILIKFYHRLFLLYIHFFNNNLITLIFSMFNKLNYEPNK